jgi:uridine kinase
MNIANATEIIHICHSDNEAMQQMQNQYTAALRFIANKLGISKFQAAMLASATFIAVDNAISIQQWAASIHIGPISMIAYRNEIQQLVDRGWIIQSSNKELYTINKEFMEAIADNIEYKPKPAIVASNTEEFFDEIDKASKLYIYLLNDMTSFVQQVSQISSRTQKLQPATSILDIINSDGTLFDKTLLIHVILQLATQKQYLKLEIVNKFGDNNSTRHYLNMLYRNSTWLQQHKLIMFAFENGEEDHTQVMLTDSAVAKFLPGSCNIVADYEIYSTLRITPDEIKARSLYYNEKENADVLRLGNILTDPNYSDIMSKLSNKGYDKQLIILFNGENGTGKTETAIQLAKQTERAIYVVTQDSFKNKIVESEKTLNCFFNTYNNDATRSIHTPIMLLTGIDEFIRSRERGTKNTAQDRETAVIQDHVINWIINTKGIIIIASSLEQDIDKRLDRKFSYRISFEKPNESIREKIWKSNLPELSDDDAHTLAKRFSLTGGQISNVVRRNYTSHILYDTPIINTEQLATLSQAEIDDANVLKRMGFRSH